MAEELKSRFAAVLDKSLRNNGVSLTGAELKVVSKDVSNYVKQNLDAISKEATAELDEVKKEEKQAAAVVAAQPALKPPPPPGGSGK